MQLNVPERVLELLADITPENEHDSNGPGEIVCPACGGFVEMKWKAGYVMNGPSDVVHDADCPAEWARRVLAANT